VLRLDASSRWRSMPDGRGDAPVTTDPARAGRHLHERLAVLAEIATLADGRVPPEVAVRVAATTHRATGRLGHGAGHTVVALAGATGSGKSSTFNALAGRESATTGVRRPTTSSTLAAVFTTDSTLRADVTGLLSWLEVHQHVVVDDPELDGLVLLDLPDHDSTHAAHRQEVDRLVRVVDVFVWVVDPQKYADAALHHGYLRRFAGHAGVTVVVLNQIDKLPTDDAERCLGDVRRLLDEDGLDGVRLLGTSAKHGAGVDELRELLAETVAERQATLQRLAGDVDTAVDGDGTVSVTLTKRGGQA
jgi:GTP-binding protein EngB required for normal cell division